MTDEPPQGTAPGAGFARVAADTGTTSAVVGQPGTVPPPSGPPVGGPGTSGPGIGSPAGPPGDDGPTGGGGGEGSPKKRAGARRWITEWAVIIVVALVAAFVVRTYVAQTFYVPSTSMFPTLKAGDRIVVNKVFSTINRGDIVVFRRPPREDCGGQPVPDLVKRVVGLPGEHISARGGVVYVTGNPLQEPWLPRGPQAETTNFGPVTVPRGEYFVMGDNRVNSCDSRMWGSVERSYIVGKVFLIIWPLSQFRYF